MVANQLLIKRNNIVVGLFGVCTSFLALTYNTFEANERIGLFSVLFLTGFLLTLLGFKNTAIKNKKVNEALSIGLSLCITLLIGILVTAYRLAQY